jgi:kynureninase
MKNITERILIGIRFLIRFAGWWGSNPDVKFGMDLDFQPINGAQGYRLSNPSVFTVIALKASLDIFDKTSMDELSKKSKDLTGYLEYLLNERIPKDTIKIITPLDPNQRGCQLSILFLKSGQMKIVFEKLSEMGVICDERKPDVLRVAPAPLYNTFSEVWNFVDLLKQAL